MNRCPLSRAVVALLSLTALMTSSAFGATPAETLLALPRPVVIAHRGYSAFAPENTRTAFDLALSAEVDLVELDYHHAADGVPVVIHDLTLDRTTDAMARWGGKDLPVVARTSMELRGLEAGLWFPPPLSGERVPTLEEAVTFIQRRGVTLIERKAGDAGTLARLLQERGWVNQVVVQSFDWGFLAELLRLEPRQILGALGPPGTRDGRRLSDDEKRLDGPWLREIRDLGAQIVVWNRQVSREAIREAHDAGLRVWVYTINEAPLAADLLRMGVDGIITDNPALIWRTLAVTPPRG